CADLDADGCLPESPGVDGHTGILDIGADTKVHHPVIAQLTVVGQGGIEVVQVGTGVVVQGAVVVQGGTIVVGQGAVVVVQGRTGVVVQGGIVDQDGVVVQGAV